MTANNRQVGGRHYQGDNQHWDWVWDNDLDYFQGQITKYVARWKDKNGLEDLAKARHFLEKYIELIVSEKDMSLEGITLNNCVPIEKVCNCDIKSGCDVHKPECPLSTDGEAPSGSYVNQD